MKMPKCFLWFFMSMCLPLTFLWAGASDGEKTFKTICLACHTIGKGKLVGPDLKGVHERHSKEWLTKFIKSSQTLIKSGDADAVKLFNEYNKMPMPDHDFNDAQINDLLAYIKAQSGAPAKKKKVVKPKDPKKVPTQAGTT